MRRRIDAARQAADHDETARGDRSAARRSATARRVRRRRARSDDGDGGAIERGRRAAHPEHRGRIDDRRQRGRIRWIVPGDSDDAGRACPFDRSGRRSREAERCA